MITPGHRPIRGRLAPYGASRVDTGVSRVPRPHPRPAWRHDPPPPRRARQHATGSRPSASVTHVRTPGPLVLDALVWVVFAVLFVGAALLVKVAAALLVVLIVLALLLGLVLRALRKRRARPRR